MNFKQTYRLLTAEGRACGGFNIIGKTTFEGLSRLDKCAASQSDFSFVKIDRIIDISLRE